MYTGGYRAPKETGITQVDNIWEHVHVGEFVAVSLEGYEKKPVIGTVIEKGQSVIKIHYWKGSWNKKWMPWMYGRGKPWTDDLPKDSIYLTSFSLDEQGKLGINTKRQMRDFFQRLKRQLVTYFVLTLMLGLTCVSQTSSERS